MISASAWSSGFDAWFQNELIAANSRQRIWYRRDHHQKPFPQGGRRTHRRPHSLGNCHQGHQGEVSSPVFRTKDEKGADVVMLSLDNSRGGIDSPGDERRCRETLKISLRVLMTISQRCSRWSSYQIDSGEGPIFDAGAGFHYLQ
jgi:hypothetical protein